MCACPPGTAPYSKKLCRLFPWHPAPSGGPLKGNPAEREPPVTRLRFEAPRNQRPKAQNSIPEQRVVSRRKNRLTERINLAITVLPQSGEFKTHPMLPWEGFCRALP